MHKIMTRAQHQPGARPPGRRDSRRPGGAPPRIPGGTPARTAAGGGRPRGSRADGLSTVTGPADNRPPTAPAAPARSLTTALNAPGLPPGPATPSHGTATVTAAPGGQAAVAPASDTTAAPGAPAVAAARATTQAPPDKAPAPGETALAPAAGTTADHPPCTAVHASAHLRPVLQPRPTDVFADLLLAVLSGQRPVHSMLRHTAGRAYDELAWLAERGPLRTRGTRPVVRDIGYYEARPGAVEAFARIGAGDQLRAMAFRLERGQDLRWRCTAVELGGPRPPRSTGDD
ncbi:Rv3235 family protein [Streptomyces guryensis]|uniref:Rv3235 family protein n=1 Tax=Streptomyces guryensis TaxID=2886947 RepID=A0A9Q3Z7S1_9ACTN|nr:Rv3235 family protein [Streptomyces guryensis]MCD9878516.1 Rv3235 family protein [Streptomyces guryensis]